MAERLSFPGHSDAYVKAFRNMMQKVTLENDARAALAEARESGDAERIRLATEAFDHRAFQLNAAILDFRETQREDTRDDLATLRNHTAHSAGHA